MRDLRGSEITEFDNDWYCIINNHPVHIASMCGNIPIHFRNLEALRRLQKQIADLQYITMVSLNLNLINNEIIGKYSYLQDRQLRTLVEELNRTNNNVTYNMNWTLEVRLFANTFVDKARKGFYSYARVGQTNEWFLVAVPEIELDWRASELDLNVLELDAGDQLPIQFSMPQ